MYMKGDATTEPPNRVTDYPHVSTTMRGAGDINTFNKICSFYGGRMYDLRLFYRFQCSKLISTLYEMVGACCTQ